MTRSTLLILLPFFLFACQTEEKPSWNEETLASLGGKYRTDYLEAARSLEARIEDDSTDVQALVELAETHIILFIFGFTSREETIPEAQKAFEKAWELDSLHSRVLALSGKLRFLDWDWEGTKMELEKALVADPGNHDARHWYSLYLIAMGHPETALAHSDTIMSMDTSGNYLIGRGSLFYFEERFEELKHLMYEAIAADTLKPWGYDWLGMAYNGLEEHEESVSTYLKAFELSDGTVEVGGGLGHALGDAGFYDQAKQMADSYSLEAQDHYLPPVQRAFIHIGMDDYETALQLLEQAYEEKSWFLIFMKIEPWYNPLRSDERFANIMSRMNYPG